MSAVNEDDNILAAESEQAAREGRSKGSRVLFGVDGWTGHPLTALRCSPPASSGYS